MAGTKAPGSSGSSCAAAGLRRDSTMSTGYIEGVLAPGVPGGRGGGGAAQLQGSFQQLRATGTRAAGGTCGGGGRWLA
jgi:hypothetical protein